MVRLRPSRLGLAAVAALVSVGAGCELVKDVDYRGERTLEFAVDIAFLAEDVPRDEVAALRTALVWGDESHHVVRVDPVALSCGARMGCVIEVFSRAPEAALRDGTTGRFAIGEIVFFHDGDDDQAWDASEAISGRGTLVVFSPDGAESPQFTSAIPAGMRVVDAMAPCDVTPQTFVLAPPDEIRKARLRRRILDRYADGQPHFFDPACPSRLALYEVDCPAFDIVRWVCRNRSDATELCQRCEYLVFPPNATPNDCLVWESRWRDRGLERGDRSLEEIAAEVRLCQAGEPTVERPCDHTCACDKRRDLCFDERADATYCDYERSLCLEL